MNDTDRPGSNPGNADNFEKQANKKSNGLVTELIAFLLANKAWWLAPIVLALLLLGLLVFLGGTGAAPFIYVLF